ncbi:MAG: hypothetical protein KAT65_23605 [Methanophagales archaeon]|nr:hypothetical protein [Methanophagales archaeon]
MKSKIVADLIAVVVIASVMMFAGCVEEEPSELTPTSTPKPIPTPAPVVSSTPTPTPTSSPLLEIETPNWDLKTTETVKIATSERLQGELHSLERTIHMSPPFYEGSIPFTYRHMTVELTPPPCASYIEIHHDFGDFQNLFIYENQTLKFNGIPNGAITMDKSGNRLAEARFLGFIESENKTKLITIEEFHYDNGKLIFYCKSHIDDFPSYKIKELDIIGKKGEEYYYIYPSMTGIL